MTDMSYTADILDSLSQISPQIWNRLANPAHLPYDPFISWDFLEAMERSGSARPDTGWTPCHLMLRDSQDAVCAVMPLYAKTHSQGEFVFDHAWADAFHRAGGPYYPKLLGAVPFTPVSGRRLLTGDAPPETAHTLQLHLLSAAVQLAAQNNFSSLHVNFIHSETAKTLADAGLLIRTDQQFHWTNQDYADFDAFLAHLSSAKRKNLRKERQKAQQGLTFTHLNGSDIQEHHWDAFFAFYMDTGGRKWGSPYLTREAFSLLGERLSPDILLILAYAGERPIAGALNLIGGEALYGRYWGCAEARPFLHFETCYYQAIDYAIEKGLKRVEAGAQGGHKLARGYAPVTTHSAHWIAHKGLREAIGDYLDHERDAVQRETTYLQSRTPFKKS